MDTNNNISNLAAIIGQAVGQAVAPLYDKLNQMERQEQQEQQSNEPETYSNWDKVVKEKWGKDYKIN